MKKGSKMRTGTSTGTALALALLLALPVLAAGAQGDTVTKTLELTLHGNVTRDRVFGAFYYVSPETHPAGLVQFCGPQVQGGQPPSQVISQEECAGMGRVYTAELEFKRGAGVFVEFVTLSVDDPQNTLEFFVEVPEMNEPESIVYETLEADSTTSAAYSFSAGDGRQPSGMPATGAGGISHDSLRISAITAGLSLLAAGGYVLRRRQTSSGL